MPSVLTAEEFDSCRHELPDGGRWSELVRGAVLTHEPQEDSVGPPVMNLTKALGTFAASRPTGYACYDLGIVVARAPDTVWFPAVAWFAGGPRFAEVDRTLTQSVPSLVVEVPSTNDRRRGLSERIARWHEIGVELLWIVDPRENVVHALPRGGSPRQLAGDDVLHGEPVLEGFALTVSRLFAEPDWWRK